MATSNLGDSETEHRPPGAADTDGNREKRGRDGTAGDVSEIPPVDIREVLQGDKPN